MENTLKFGVTYRRNICSDVSKTLMTADATSSLRTILQQACANFCLPENNEGIYQEPNQRVLPINDEEYCFLKRDDNGRSIGYITEENRHLLFANIVHLVPIPSMAAQQFIETIESLSNDSSWKDKDFETIFAILTEITNLLPCQKFATEFLKARGHESIFSLVERFCCLSEESNPVPSSSSVLCPASGWWSYFAACLVELAEYGLNSSKEQDSDGDEEEYMDNDKRDTLVAQISEAPEFSWFLVSENFLSCLILQCRLATELKTVRDSVRTLLKIMNDCPAKVEQVIKNTGPAFIFDLLEKVHEHEAASTQVDEQQPQANTTQSTLRNVLSRVGSISLSSASSRSQLTRFESATTIASGTDQTTDQLSVEIISLLLDMLYVILYHSDESVKLTERFQMYLSPSRLQKIYAYYPQPRRPSTAVERSQQLDGTESTANQLDCVLRDPALSCNDGMPVSTRSMFYFQDVCNLTVQSNGSFRAHKTENDVVAGLLRIQQAYLAYLAAELQVPLDDEFSSGLEKLNKLCQIAALELDPMLSDPDQTELLYAQLGFRNPKNPLEDFQPSPGRLGYTSLLSFVEHHSWLLKQMFNYRPDTQRSMLNPMIGTTLRKISSGTGISLRPSKSISSIKEVSNQTSPRNNRASSPSIQRKTADIFSFTQSSTADALRPLFPVVTMATELVKMLCEVLKVSRYLKPLPRWHTRAHSSPSKLFCPILFQSRNQLFTPFQELFASTFVVLFDTWTQLNAEPNDLGKVLSVVREQLTQALDQRPCSFDEYERILTRCTPRAVRTAWKESEEKTRCQRMDTHKVLKGLKERLTKQHEPNLKEQRLNYITRHGVLDYFPSKQMKKEVVLSPDRNSLLVHDSATPNSIQTPQHLHHSSVCEIWPLACVDRVSAGVEERVKKIPERTIVIYRRTHESLELNHLVARSDLEYTYWMDVFSILLKRSSLSDAFHKDVQRLVELDVRVRLCGLDLLRLPNTFKNLPPDPPEFDFEEECI